MVADAIGSGHGAITRTRLRGLLVTADVSSRLADAPVLIDGLHREATKSSRCVLADCGGFFGPGRYYEFGGGRIERDILARYYDIVAPSAFGFRHYLQDDRLRAKAVCVNVVDRDGHPVFAPYKAARIAGTHTVITSVIGRDAFRSIPPREREGLRWSEPTAALNALGARKPPSGVLYRALMVLTLDTSAAARLIARRSPAITAIFTGSDPEIASRPVREGGTRILTGREPSASYAMLRAGAEGWSGHAANFPEPASSAPTREVGELVTQISLMNVQLDMPLGRTRSQWRKTIPDRRELLTRVAQQVLAHVEDIGAVVLNETVITPQWMDVYLTRGAVLDIAPGRVRLVSVELGPEDTAKLPDLISPHLGPALAVHGPGSNGRLRVATTRQIAHEILGLCHRDLGPLSDHLMPTLTTNSGTPAIHPPQPEDEATTGRANCCSAAEGGPR